MVDHIFSQSYWEKFGNASQDHQKADRQISYSTIGRAMISTYFNNQGREVRRAGALKQACGELTIRFGDPLSKV